jgi:hypothetical protein
MIYKQFAVGTFSSYQATELALRELKDNGFVMDRVSIVGRDINNYTEVTGANTSNRLADISKDNLPMSENKAGETATDGAIAGMTLGGFTGLLVGLGAIAIPGVGPVMLAGAAATALASTISGGVIGGLAGGLAGGLVGLGIPSDRAKVYSDRLAEGDYLVIVEGSEDDLRLAESIFNQHGVHEWRTYSVPDESAPTTTEVSAYQLRG